MKNSEDFVDFFGDGYMEVISHEHGRYIEFVVEDGMGESIKFKLGYSDIESLKSFLSNNKKY